MAKLYGHQLRWELKYYITQGEYLVLRQRLAAAMPRDAHSGANGYLIRSLYFDDIYNSAMWEKANGDMMRKKYRIRLYQDQSIHLEKKMKYNQMTAKDSTEITRRLADALIGGDLSAIPLGRNPLVDEMYGEMRTKQLRPVVIVDYLREAYVYQAGNVRITFDRNIASGQFNHDLFDGLPAPVPVLPPGVMVLEVKYDNVLPDHIRGILNTVNGTRSAISKYGLCRRYH